MHQRLSTHRGKPKHCELCGKTDPSKRYEWAYIGGDRIDVENYRRMCVPCHRRHDGNLPHINKLKSKSKMITKTQSFQTSDGTIHASIEDAQAWELKALLMQDTLNLSKEQQDATAKILVTYRDKVIDALTTGPRSKPKARSINGGTKRRTSRGVNAPSPTPAPTAAPERPMGAMGAK